MQMIQFQIGQTFPIVLACFDNGAVALLKANGFRPVYETPTHGHVAGTFYEGNFTLESCNFLRPPSEEKIVDLEYNTQYNYKTIPLLLAWLKQQNLQPPMFQGGL